MKRNRSEELPYDLIRSLKLPGDVILGDLKCSLTGNREAWIENYKGLLEYSATVIILQGKNTRVVLEGEMLSIDYYTNEDMKISGIIECVRFC